MVYDVVPVIFSIKLINNRKYWYFETFIVNIEYWNIDIFIDIYYDIFASKYHDIYHDISLDNIVNCSKARLHSSLIVKFE